MTPRQIIFGCAVVAAIFLAVFLGIVFTPLIRSYMSPHSVNAGGNTTTGGDITHIDTGFPSPASTGGVPNTADCTGYVPTGGGATATLPFTVKPGCVAIVQGVRVHSSNSYNWDTGGVAGVGPGDYNFTITDGSYQITDQASGKNLYCRSISTIHANAGADNQNYPLDGWTC